MRNPLKKVVPVVRVISTPIILTFRKVSKPLNRGKIDRPKLQGYKDGKAGKNPNNPYKASTEEWNAYADGYDIGFVDYADDTDFEDAFYLGE